MRKKLPNHYITIKENAHYFCACLSRISQECGFWYFIVLAIGIIDFPNDSLFVGPVYPR